MIGAILGDIVGSIYEFDNIKTKEFELFDKECFFTDDSVMTIAIAEALMQYENINEKNIAEFKENLITVMHKIGCKYPDCGYGGHFLMWIMLSGEIIQIGAVKLDERYHLVDTFKIMVTPKYYRTMYRKVSKLTNIKTEDLQYGFPFKTAFKHFRDWCGDITGMSENKFVYEYIKWAKKKGYHPNETKAKSLYANALECIPTLPSNSPSTKMLVLEAAKAVENIETTLATILSQMSELAKTLPEISVVREMSGVGDVLAPRIIAEIGDVRRFHSASALIAYAGIDAPPYQSGSFYGSNRKISKRGSASLRKTGYEIM